MSKTIENVYGIDYKKPKVYLLQQSGIGVAEYAGRTAYDSFNNSENNELKALNYAISNDKDTSQYLIDNINDINSSELLDSLAWVHHHHSVTEHINLSYLIKGTSRGVLQEHARHRIQSITVRSTRYTMSSVINAFITSLFFADTEGFIKTQKAEKWFINKILELDIFVTSPIYNEIEAKMIFEKLHFQLLSMPSYDEFIKMALSKSALENFRNPVLYDGLSDVESVFKTLEESKKKRNIGDAFKHIVTDNWKVDMVVTFNLRSLKNYFDLRDSGAAYFQIQWLAEEMKKATPKKYLKLIDKNYKEKK